MEATRTNRTNRGGRIAIAAATAATVAAGLIALSAAPASAQTGSNAKQLVESKIDQRLAHLHQLQGQVTASKDVTDADRGALTTIISNEIAGLTDLRAKVDAETDLKAIAADGKSMIDDYRVYVVVTPQVHLTLATDVGEHVIGVADDTIGPKLDAAIAKAQANGKDVSKAQADDGAFKAAVAAAATDLDGLDATLLAQTPHGYPDNHQTFLDARARIADARAQLATARTAAHNVVADLKSA